MATIRFAVDGKPVTVSADPDMPLLYALRGDLKMTNPHFGCGLAQCGACTVHVNGQPVRSCQTALSEVDGKTVTTIEGVRGRVAEAVQNAWIKLAVPQCGYCQSGQIMSAIGLLTDNRKPTDADIDAALSGNLCRCSTYQRIRAAVKDAATALGD